MKKYLSIGFVTLFILIGAFSANQAEAVTWTGASSTDWGNNNNWSGGTPTGGATIDIPGSVSSGRYPVATSSITGLTGTININTAGTGASLTIIPGGSISITGAVTTNVGGTLIVSGGTLTTLTTNDIVNNGTFLLSSGTTTLGRDLRGSGTTTLSGGLLQVKRDINITNPTLFSATGGMVEFTGNSSSNAFTTTGTYQFWDVTVDAGFRPGFSRHTPIINITNNLNLISTAQTDFQGSSSTANALYLDGVATSSGTWGSTAASAATYQNNTYFLSTATGLVTVGTSTTSGGHPRSHVPDTTAPVITILGNNPATTSVDSIYVDAGATAEDDLNGNVTSRIVAMSNITTSIAGTYYVIYSVTDTSGNSATATRTVYVIGTSTAVATTTPPFVVIAQPQQPQPIIISLFKFLMNLKFGDRNHDVVELQNRLKSEGYFTYPVSTGYFGIFTKSAVILYQETYASEVLWPLGLTKGTGFVGTYTRAKLNQ